MIINNSFFKIHNKFELKLYDKDGNIKQEAFGYNEANSNRYIYASIYGGVTFDSIVLGVGDVSTSPPTSTDAHLISFKMRQKVSFIRQTEFSKDFNKIEYISSEAVFPATANYRGDLTEIGIAEDKVNDSYYTSKYSYLFSHAALVDAENNPIIIKKTEFDKLKVTSIIYIQPILKDIDSSLNFKFFPAYSSALGGGQSQFTKTKTTSNPNSHSDNFLFTKIFPSALGGTTFYFSPQYVPESSDGKIYDNAMSTVEKGTTSGAPSSFSINPYPFSTSYNYSASPTIDISNNIYDCGPCFPVTMSALNMLSTQTYDNFGFAHSIILPSFGAISLPCKQILAPYVLKNISIGVGDGSTKYFFNSINELMLGEDGNPIVDVYLQNSETENKFLLDKDEYEFVNFNIKKSPLWNKMIYVENTQTNERYEKNSYLIDGTMCKVGICALTNMSFSIPKLKNITDIYAPNINYSPVYYDENGITIDEARVGTEYFGFINAHNFYDYSMYNINLTLSYRNSEEEEWTNIEISTPNNGTFEVIKFTPVTAKYWKLSSLMNSTRDTSYTDNAYFSLQGSNRLGISGMSNAYTAAKNGVYGIDPNYIVVGNSAEYDFAKVGLNFKTAPPEGAIITMDATLDLPYKTPDGSMTFSYQATLNAPASN